MKKSALLSFVCASLIVNLPVAAATQPAATPVAPAQSTGVTVNIPDQKAMLNLMHSVPAWRVYEPIAQEMLRPYVTKPVTKMSLNRLTDFQFSEATQASFKEMFGNPDPLHINVNDNQAGGQDVTYLLQALDYTDPQSNNHSHWDALSGTLTYAKDFKHFKGVADWPYFSQSIGTDFSVEFKQIHVVQDAAYNQHHMALGTAQISIPELKINAGSSEKTVVAKNLLMSSDTSQQGTKLNMVLEMSTSEVQFSGHIIDPIHVDYHFLNLNEAPLAELVQQAVKLNKAEPSMEKRLAASNKLLTTKLLPVLSPSSRFEIRDLSVVFQSMKAILNGAVWLEKAKQSDMSNIKTLQEKIAAHFELSMPKAFVLKITKYIGSFQPGTDTEQRANAGLQALIAAGMIKEEQDQLSVVFDYMNGSRKVNGHELNGKTKK